jgi:membrane-associated phospholipid phosphatase
VSRRTTIAILLWLAVIAAAMSLDRLVATNVRTSGLEAWMEARPRLEKALDFPGTYWCTAIIVVIVALTHAKRWQAGGFVLLATVVSGINGLVKWIVGRTRPFKLGDGAVAQPFALEPFCGGLPGIFHSKNLCFPSGHAALAFATAAAVAMLWPRAKWRWVAYVIATIAASERVLENAHWLSDAVAGAALGVGGVYVIAWAVTRASRPRPEQNMGETPMPL